MKRQQLFNNPYVSSAGKTYYPKKASAETCSTVQYIQMYFQLNDTLKPSKYRVGRVELVA